MSSQSDLNALNAARRGHWVSQIQRHAQMMPDEEALEFEDVLLTWAQLHERIRRVATVLRARGVSQGDRVAVAMGNRHQLVEAILAANSLGAMAVPLNFRFSAGEFTYAFEDSGALVVVSDDVTRATVRQALANTNHGLGHITVGEAGPGEASYEEELAKVTRLLDPVDLPEDTPALIMYTSGTTGAPKGAVLTFRNILSQATVLSQAYGGFGREDVTLVSSPLFHIGAIGGLAPALHLGTKTVIFGSKPFDPVEILEILESRGIAFTFMVPTQWQVVCEAAKGRDLHLPRLRVLGWGAAPATDVLLQTMLETFPQGSPVALFGQTEMSPVTCVLEGEHARRKLGSVGRPVPQVHVRVVDPFMEDVEPGTVGEIVYRGSGLMKGYWNKPEETAKAFEGGWFHSGDLVYRDEEGFYYVVDRIKDMLISGGENIYCAEVENALSTHPSIQDVSIVGKPHPQWGETPVAFVVLKPGAAEITIEELREHGGQRLARFKLPTALVIADELPRNTSGKILKGKLRERTQEAAS